MLTGAPIEAGDRHHRRAVPRCWPAAGCAWRRGARSRRSRTFARSARSRSSTTRTTSAWRSTLARGARHPRTPSRRRPRLRGARAGTPSRAAARNRRRPSRVRDARGRRGRACPADRGDRVAPQLPGSARARAGAFTTSAPRGAAPASGARRASRCARGLSRRAVWCGSALVSHPRGARGHGRPPAPRPGLRAGGAHSRRAARRGARRERTDQSRNRARRCSCRSRPSARISGTSTRSSTSRARRRGSSWGLCLNGIVTASADGAGRRWTGPSAASGAEPRSSCCLSAEATRPFPRVADERAPFSSGRSQATRER